MECIDIAMSEHAGSRGQSQRAKIERIWTCGMLLSFFWELPLWYMTSMDRINPRFYDIFFLIGLVLFGSRLFFEKVDNPIYRCWRNIVFWFTICSLFYSSFVGWAIAQFSLLCAVRYIQGLLVMKMILLQPPKRVIKILEYCCWIGLAVICIYCFYEYRNHQLVGAITEIEITAGKSIAVFGNFLFGPLSFSYFHLAQLIPLAFSVVIFPLLGTKTMPSKRGISILLMAAIFMSWPILWNGSRTGMGLYAICLVAICLLLSRKGPLSLLFVIIIMVIALAMLARTSPPIFENAATLNRYETLADSEVHGLKGRTDPWRHIFFVSSNYDYWYFLPFFGAGFNFAPVDNNYRICYGIHCSPLYPLEQAGIIGLVLFLIFVVTSLRTMWKARMSNPLAYAGISYLCASLICGITGAHNFWREFNTGNLNTLILIVLCLSASRVFEQPGGSRCEFY